ncbi:MAG: hypothetical protein J6B16_00930 [Clostridia bacterium]|nr:hypothetical protein [Clostridia bacterium]
MAGKILTPVTLWENFRILSTDFKVLRTFTENGVTFTELYVYRPVSRTDKVAIYTKLAYVGSDFSNSPTLFLLQDVGQEISDVDLKFIVSRGYSVVAMDIAGDNGKVMHAVGNAVAEAVNENVLSKAIASSVAKNLSTTPNEVEREYSPYTIYPESLSYAKYLNAKNNLLGVGLNANESPYYQWCANARYVIGYLKNVEKISKIGVIALKDAVTIGFHLASTERLDAFVSLYGCGWQLPNGYKYSPKLRSDYSAEEHRVLAGIEAQSYASYVTCPTLMHVATNYPYSDFDRAYDTYLGIKDEVYSVINYTVGTGAYLTYSSFRDCELFFNKFLKGRDVYIPQNIDLEVDIENGKIRLQVTADVDALEFIEVYASDGVVEPEYRCWKRIKDFRLSETDNGRYTFNYSPVKDNGIALFFAKAQYRNGFKISSQVVAKRYQNNEVECRPQFNVIYSSRDYAKNGIFEAINTNVDVSLCMKTQPEVLKEIRGPLGILGLPATRGLTTFNVLKPSFDAMLVMDVFTETDLDVKVELISDQYTAKEMHYFAVVKVVGGNIWNKVQIEKSRFKTIEGFHLKSYDNVKSIKILGDGNFAINNILWV